MAKKTQMNNKQRVYIMTLFLVWFAIGNVLVQHLHYNIFFALCINSIILPLGMALPVVMLWDYLGGNKIPFIDAP